MKKPDSRKWLPGFCLTKLPRNRREQQAAQRMEALRQAAAECAAADEAYAAARAALHEVIAGGPLGALLRARRSRAEAAYAFSRVLPSGNDDKRRAAADALGVEGVAARRALYGLPGQQGTAALPPAQDDSEFAWLVESLLNMPALTAAVRELSIQMNQGR
jgi:hypothetical protein